MNYFPNNDEEISLIKFIAKFQYLAVNDAKYFFSSRSYYRSRIKSLIDKRYIKKLKSYLVLDEIGIEYVKMLNFEYSALNRNKKYVPRLVYISHLGAFYHNSNTIKYTPSFIMKDKEMFTITARRFIGILDINRIEYLSYSITDKHDNKYQNNVIYDIQKERKYRNIIVFVNDINRIYVEEFAFGYNQVLVIEDNEINREKLKYLNSINWSKVIEKYYRNSVYIAEYNFCDYTDYKNKYISTFYFLDTEKINRIKYFLRENKNKNADIICSAELKSAIQKELPQANFITINMEEFIDKERKIYG